MKCPFCNKDMETGFVKFDVRGRGYFKGELLWQDENNKSQSEMRLNEHHNDEYSGLPVYKAFKCDYCEKIIMNTLISDIAKKICPKCGASIDWDYPKCPKCKHVF
ncbi:MAG: PF20097 family protein [Ruminococcus sp.]